MRRWGREDSQKAENPNKYPGVLYYSNEKLIFKDRGHGIISNQIESVITEFHLFIVAKQERLISTGKNDRFLFVMHRNKLSTIELLTNSISGRFEAIVYLRSQKSPIVIASVNSSDQMPHLHEVYYNGNEFGYLIDGYYQGIVNIEGELLETDHSSIVIGNHHLKQASIEGEISAVAFFNRRLNDAEVCNITHYLKGIIELPAIKHNQPVIKRENDEQGFKSPSIQEYNADTLICFYTVRKNNIWQGITYATATKESPHKWIKSNKLILTRSEGGWDSHHISDVWAMKDQDGGWKFLYADRQSGAIGLATGPDIHSLQKYPKNPVLMGSTGWEKFVRYPTFIRLSDTYHLFYDGRYDSPAGVLGAIGHATSKDLINWKRDPNNPIISPSDLGGGWELHDCCQPAICFIDGEYYLFWAGYNQDLISPDFPHQIGVAKFENLSGWRKSTFNPVLSWDYGGWGVINASEPCVFTLNNNIYIYFMSKSEIGGTGGDLGYAVIPADIL